MRRKWVSRIKVLIADDQELFAAGLSIILRGHGSEEISVVGIAANGREAVRMTAEKHPDVVLMDVRMPQMDGVEATKIIHERFPDVKILILTTFDDDQYVLNALGNGAIGYILKNVGPDELVMSVRTVHGGSFLVSPAVGYKLVQHANAGADIDHDGRQGRNKRGEINALLSHFRSLSPRQAEILYLMLHDYDNHEIAQELYIAEQTVKNQISFIYDKLGVQDRIHAKKLVKSTVSAGH